MYVRKRRGALAAAVTCLAFAVIAAACGDDSSDSSSSSATTAGGSAAATTVAGPTTTAAPASDPTGIIKVAARNISATGMPLDPIKVGNLTLQTYNALVYDTLLYDDGKDLTLGLAKRVDVVSKTQLEIELPANAKFTDGTAVDGDALKFSLERSIASNARTAFDGLLFTAVDSIVVKSPTVVTINLKAPVAGAFRALLARGEGMIVSPTAVKAGTDLATKPVGAGPFVLDKLDINGTTSFKKNPTYVNADAIKVAGIEFVNVADATAATNALRSGVVDFVNGVDNATASTLNAKPYATIQQVSGNRYITLSLCLSQAPLNNLQVRQALNYALDKDAMNTALFDGKGEVMADMWPKSSPYFTAQSGVGFDQKKAKDLLTQANVGPITLRAVVDPTSPTTARLFELAQAQLKDVGITLTQVTTTNIAVDFFNTGNPATRKGDVAALVTSFIGINRVRPFVTGFPANACGYTDPPLEAAAGDIRSADAGSAEAKAAWAKFDKFVFDNALAVWGVWATDISAYNSDRLGGVSLVPDPSGGLVMNFVKTFVKKK